MEIAIVGGIEPVTTKPGGTRSYVMNLMENLCNKNEGVTLYGVSIDSKSEFSYKGCKFKPVMKGKKISSNMFLFNLLLKSPFFKMSKNTIIHAQRPDVLFPFSLFKKKNPKICTIHGIPSIGIRRRKGRATSGIYNSLERYSLKRANRIVFVDTKTEEWYLRRYDWLKGKSNVIPVGIDLNRFKPLDKKEVRKKYGFDHSDKIILYVGRLEIEKRIDLLIESYKKLTMEIDAKLVIVGEGPEKNRLMTMARNHNIIFLGTLPHEKIPEIMNCADVLVLCSEYEGMPTVVLEALACGKPVASTDVGDVKKVILNGQTGYLTELNVDNIKEKLSTIIKNSEKYKYNCVEISKKYSWDLVSEKIIDIYREVHDEVSKES